MDAYAILVKGAIFEFEKGDYTAAERLMVAAKALKNQRSSRADVDLATRKMIENLGRAVGEYDPTLANAAATTGVAGPSAARPGPGRKELLAPPALDLSDDQARLLHAAATGRQTARVEVKARTKTDPSGPVIGQPPAILPVGVAPTPMPREPSRILDLVPLVPAPGPFMEYFATAGGSAAAAVAEGQPKPQSFPRWARIPVRATKVAHFVEASDESITDFPNFLTLVTDDLTAGLIDAENRELLSATADATVHGWAGLLNTSGILARTRGSESALDTLEMAVADLRTGPAFCAATGVVLHPDDWSAIRRSKDLQLRYLATDPLNGAANTLWGVQVVQTTQIAQGTAMVADFWSAALAYLVASLRLDVDRGGDAFTSNLTRIRCEERLILTVPRPAAICAVDGL